MSNSLWTTPAGIKTLGPYAPLKGHKDIRQYLYRAKICCAVRKKTRKTSCFLNYVFCFWDQSGVAINVFNRRATGSHSWVKLPELNFLKTNNFPRLSNQVHWQCHIQSICFMPSHNKTTVLILRQHLLALCFLDQEWSTLLYQHSHALHNCILPYSGTHKILF